jgi:hypothetical protein
MIHLIKLAVGVRDPAHLAAIQASRAVSAPPLRHQTRNMPKRAAEIIDGGSLYWVIGGAVLLRQRVLNIVEDVWDDGAKCTGLVLDPALVRVAARPVKAFQGWRYLTPEDAPPDLASSGADADLPDDMRRALAALGLL